MKKCLSLLLLLVLFGISSYSLTTVKAQESATGKCGEEVSYSFDDAKGCEDNWRKGI